MVTIPLPMCKFNRIEHRYSISSSVDVMLKVKIVVLIGITIDDRIISFKFDNTVS